VYQFSEERATSKVLERPGQYFAGPIGTLIPAGGRLLLAIAERLAADRGITYAFCDTDSLAFARPTRMSRKRFHALVDETVAWFEPLSPFAGQASLLKIEKENTYGGKRTPLCFLGVSAKRYVLYNRLPGSRFRIRKFSAHGTGTWTAPRAYASPLHIPEPEGDVEDLGGERWLYDLWYDAIEQAEAGKTEIIPSGWGPDVPALHQVTISTMALATMYQKIEGLWPFSFLTVLPPLSPAKRLQLETQAPRKQRRAQGVVDEKIVFEEPDGDASPSLRNVSFYAPYGRSLEEIRGKVRRSDTHELVDLEHTTMAETLLDYFQHPEAKMANPTGIGELQRRHVWVVDQVFIGKETNEVLEEVQEESGGALTYGDAQQYGRTAMTEFLRQYTEAELIEATGLARQTIRNLLSGRVPRKGTRKRLMECLTRLQEMNGARE
jgi:hypothetical protein